MTKTGKSDRKDGSPKRRKGERRKTLLEAMQMSAINQVSEEKMKII